LPNLLLEYQDLVLFRSNNASARAVALLLDSPDRVIANEVKQSLSATLGIASSLTLLAMTDLATALALLQW
jgi:hypothetical protein